MSNPDCSCYCYYYQDEDVIPRPFLAKGQTASVTSYKPSQATAGSPHSCHPVLPSRQATCHEAVALPCASVLREEVGDLVLQMLTLLRAELAGRGGEVVLQPERSGAPGSVPGASGSVPGASGSVPVEADPIPTG